MKTYIIATLPLTLIGIITVAIGIAMKRDPEWDGQKFQTDETTFVIINN